MTYQTCQCGHTIQQHGELGCSVDMYIGRQLVPCICEQFEVMSEARRKLITYAMLGRATESQSSSDGGS